MFTDSGRSAAELIEAIRGAGVPVDGTARGLRLRRMLLDTFDRRVERAGMELEQVQLGATTTVELREEGRPTLRATGAVAVPALADALPPGALRDRLAPVTGIRALVATARSSGRRTTVGVVNGDGKTIARLLVDEGREAAHVSVRPVRGYERQAARVAAQLATVDGLVAVAPARRTAAAKAAAMAPEQPAADAVATVLGAFLDTAEANLPGVLDDLDTEHLHDLRVAVRKARSVVKLAGDVLHGDVVRLAAELRWLGDVTTPVRDLDVYVLGVPELAARLRAADAADLAPFEAHLSAVRAAAFTQLQDDLRSPRTRRARRVWRAVATPPPDGPTTGPTVAELAAERLAKAHRRMVTLGNRISDVSPPEALHELRKRGKEYRYLLDVFQAVEAPSARRRVEPVLKALQECLGTFQDSEVQAAAIRRFATAMVAAGAGPPETLLAMGEMAARLDDEQRRARRAFADHFTAFTAATRDLRWTAGGPAA